MLFICNETLKASENSYTPPLGKFCLWKLTELIRLFLLRRNRTTTKNCLLKNGYKRLIKLTSKQWCTCQRMAKLSLKLAHSSAEQLSFGGPLPSLLSFLCSFQELLLAELLALSDPSTSLHYFHWSSVCLFSVSVLLIVQDKTLHVLSKTGLSFDNCFSLTNK